ncbi:hypothetical protein ACIBSW_05730 [Actinoplanes sp. NPDC049668]|uniref:hypothetical protein n=1 Tax=unclassified Actinoplanes TaxID=2626549 RepID=UPI0033A638C3
MTAPDLAVSFRDGDAPRALADRPLAFAHRHTRGWTLNLAGAGPTEHPTFDAVADTVVRATRVRRLLIVWPGLDGP